MSALLPPNNRPAGRAYVCGLVGMTPGLGLIAGPAAVLFGIVGWRRSVRVPEARGGGHAVVGGMLGALDFVTNVVGWGLIGYGLGWI